MLAALPFRRQSNVLPSLAPPPFFDPPATHNHPPQPQIKTYPTTNLPKVNPYV